MENSNRIEVECRNVRAALSDYIENTVSARETWRIEKHIMACTDCSQCLREMQATVSLLQAAPRHDTADDFMAKLHAQLDLVEPEAMRPLSPLAALRDRLADFGERLRNPRLPAMGLSLSALALIGIVAANQFLPTNNAVEKSSAAVSKPAVSPVVTQQINQHLAISTRSLLDDPAEANLDAHSSSEANAPGDENDLYNVLNSEEPNTGS